MKYNTCPFCGAHLDFGEECECGHSKRSFADFIKLDMLKEYIAVWILGDKIPHNIEDALGNVVECKKDMALTMIREGICTEADFVYAVQEAILAMPLKNPFLGGTE